MTTAFVLSGGGNLGAVQVGMLQALVGAGVRPDMLVGTSAGALNAALIAADPSPERIDALAELWAGVSRRDVFPASPVSALRALSGRANSFVDPTALRNLLTHHLGYERIEDARLPLTVVATDVITGAEVVLSHGNLVDAVMASAAIPSVFPPVEMDGHTLIDGGVVNNTAISVAGRQGADVIYVLPTGYACALQEPPRSALAMALHAASLAIQRRLINDTEIWQDRCTLHVVPPLCPVSVAPTDFSQTSSLIERAKEATTRWLARPPAADQTAYLALHTHDAASLGSGRDPVDGAAEQRR